LNPKKLNAFVKAFKEKTEHEAAVFREQANFTAWLQGLYIARAIAANFSKNVRYYSEPIDFNKQPDDAKAAFERFSIYVEVFNAQFEQREKNKKEVKE